MSLDGFDTLARLLSEAVLNGLWQGMALTAIVWLAMRLAPRTSSATRYSIWWATLAVVLALPFVRLATSSPDGAAVNQAIPIHLAATWPLPLFDAWAIVAAVMLGRLLWSYGYVAWLARTSVPLAAVWQDRAARLTGCTRVRIRASHETEVPAVVGFRRPAILMPNGLLDRLSAAELDQIILHEWAHIRRGDHWTNGMLELLQALFFFHPAVWCIGRALRLEREIACDDSVVAATGQPLPYAGCLAKLAELHSCPPVSLSPGAAGDSRHLFRRVERLLDWHGAARFSFPRFAAASALLLAAVLYAKQLPQFIDIPAPALALGAPRPAIEASRRMLLAEERIRAANILMETATERLATADRILRAAQQQMRLANRIAPGAATVPVSQVTCPQTGAASLPKLNKI